MEQQSDPLAAVPVAIRSDVSLSVCHAGGRQPTIVFIHGGLGNRHNWRAQVAFFREQGLATLAYDLAGHGESSAYQRYSVGRHCRDLSRLLRRLGIDDPVLCGHSYGVPIALEFVQRQRANGLILIAGGTHALDPWWEAPLMRVMEGAGRHLFASPLLQRLNRRLASLRQGEGIERYFAESPIPTGREPYRSMAVFWGYDFFVRFRRRRWAMPPTLILSGGKDPLFTPAMANQLAAHFRHCRQLHLPAAGHLLMAEEPEQVNRAMAEWIEALPPR